ncbi:MAG: hypothetical protein Q9227_002461 [Pyrenula ochraceoflavens]
MGRRKIEIKAIKDDRNRSVTFLKRKGGLFKKAHELSVLCSVDVAVIIFGHNKKLYEFSSGDINETIGRYQYYGQPHEHKGPADFRGKGGDDDDDDDEDITPPPETQAPPPQHMLPPHMQNQSFQHIRHQAPSASPPIGNGVPFPPRHGTPQPHPGSRPSSRTDIRRMSSNLVPIHHPQATPPPTQNSFPYMPNGAMYHPQAAAQPTPPPHYTHFPHHTPPQPHAQIPPPQHQQVQQAHQAYIENQQRRQSIPSVFPSQQERSQPTPPQPTPPLQQHPPPQPPPSRSPPSQPQSELKPENSSPPEPKHLSSKSRSIFTPIDERGSMLAKHFGFGSDPPRSNVKPERSDSSDSRLPTRGPPPHMSDNRSYHQPQRADSTASVPEFPPPSRTATNSSKTGRPSLKVQIPSEHSDAGSATAESSPRESGGATTATPAKSGTGSDPHHSVVLPPPSPSASALLSAGASGPPNPFARPNPPHGSQNANAYNSNNNMDTPISALPSRFVNDNLLPSPSSFYPEWGFGRSGPDSNVLPSPLTFPTPVMQTGSGFGRHDAAETGDKRKGSEERLGDVKKIKT